MHDSFREISYNHIELIERDVFAPFMASLDLLFVMGNFIPSVFLILSSLKVYGRKPLPLQLWHLTQRRTLDILQLRARVG